MSWHRMRQELLMKSCHAPVPCRSRCSVPARSSETCHRAGERGRLHRRLAALLCCSILAGSENEEAQDAVLRIASRAYKDQDASDEEKAAAALLWSAWQRAGVELPHRGRWSSATLDGPRLATDARCDSEPTRTWCFPRCANQRFQAIGFSVRSGQRRMRATGCVTAATTGRKVLHRSAVDRREMSMADAPRVRLSRPLRHSSMR